VPSNICFVTPPNTLKYKYYIVVFLFHCFLVNINKTYKCNENPCTSNKPVRQFVACSEDGKSTNSFIFLFLSILQFCAFSPCNNNFLHKQIKNNSWPLSLTKEIRIYIRVEFRQSLGMHFVSPFQPEREFKVYISCKRSQIVCSRVH